MESKDQTSEKNFNFSSSASAYDLSSVSKNLNRGGLKKMTILKGNSPYNTGNIIRTNSGSTKKGR